MALHLKLCSSFSDALTQLYALIPTPPKSFCLFLIFIFALSFLYDVIQQQEHMHL